MKIVQCMSKDALVIKPGTTLFEAAAAMAHSKIGMLLIGEDNRLLGAITDRDIVVRGIGAGMGSDAPVRQVMSRSVKYCFADEDVDRVAANMAAAQVRRLVVLDRTKIMIGVVSVGDLARSAGIRLAGMALGDASQPGLAVAPGP